MTDAIRQKWTQFKAAEPGERFERWYERGHAHKASAVRKILLMAAGVVLIFVGVVLLAIPGPGIPVGVIGAGLLAAESRTAARVFDWLELRLRAILARLLRSKPRNGR